MSYAFDGLALTFCKIRGAACRLFTKMPPVPMTVLISVRFLPCCTRRQPSDEIKVQRLIKNGLEVCDFDVILEEEAGPCIR